MKVMNHVIELNFRSLQPWSRMRLHRRPYYHHFVWGKISFIYGQPHLEPVTVCAECNGDIIRVGADLLDYCESCQQVEGDTKEITTEEWEALN
jgi:hypothetical protein